MNRRDPRVAIITRSRDFHAFAIADRLDERGVTAAIIETDGLPAGGGMNWRPHPSGADFIINDRTGRPISPGELELAWWRRLTGDPILPERLSDPAARDLVARDVRSTLAGGFMTTFRGRWVSDPERTRAAEHKLVQLQAAAQCGLRLPATLVSQHPEEIRRFCAAHPDGVVVKTVAGTPMTPLLAGTATPEMLADDEALALSPAIWQELVPGTRHLRVCVFGDKVLAARLTSDRLDWRYPLDAACEAVEIDPSLGAALRRHLDALGLRMGIFDLKEAQDGGEAVFLEVNPQGQFLFLEGMCGLPLTDAFTDFLIAEMAA